MTDEAKKDEVEEGARAIFGGRSTMTIDAQVITAASTTANTLIESLTNEFSKEIKKEAEKVDKSTNDAAAP